MTVIVPGSATRTSLSLPPDLDFKRWEAIGRTLRAAGDVLPWWVGDWLNYGEHAYGGKYKLALDEAQAKTWRNYAWVANRFPPSRRRDDVSWSVHAELARIKGAAARDYMLQRAAQYGWSVRVLRGMLSIRRADEAYTTAASYAAIGKAILMADNADGGLISAAEEVERDLREFVSRVQAASLAMSSSTSATGTTILCVMVAFSPGTLRSSTNPTAMAPPPMNSMRSAETPGGATLGFTGGGPDRLRPWRTMTSAC